MEIWPFKSALDIHANNYQLPWLSNNYTGVTAWHNGQYTCSQTQLPQVRFPAFSNLDVAEASPWRCLEESEQWVESGVDGTHLVLASGQWPASTTKK